MNRTIRRKFIDVEKPSRSIEQWFERITNLDRHWRESRQKEERLRDRREIGSSASEKNTGIQQQ